MASRSRKWLFAARMGLSMPHKRRNPPKNIAESSADIMRRLVLESVPITLAGQSRQVPALVAIMTALFQVQFAGNARANAVLTRFQSFVPQISELKIEFEQTDDRAEQ